MTEKIDYIAKSIKKHRELEIQGSLTNPAIGRCLAYYNQQNRIFWLTNKENIAGKTLFDLNGNPIIRQVGPPTTLTTDGITVYKNTKIGEVLIINHEGEHLITAPMGQFKIQIFNRTSYVPSTIKDEFAKDIIIKISGESKTHSFQNISKILSLKVQIEEDKKNLEHATDLEAQNLIRRIEDKELEMKKYLDKAQGFIRKYAELRYQPILDPIQETIKRSKLFNGSLIINGGPGTGKTTVLIQRIKFLISESIEEYVTLNQRQKDILFNQTTSWIFYSPNELLALFLRNSMKMEELSADTERVKVWSFHKNNLVKSYRLVDTTTKRPFLIYNKSQGRSLISNNPKSVQGVIKDLENYFIELQTDKFHKVLGIDVTKFSWKNTGFSIKNYLEDKKTIKNIDKLIRLYQNIYETYRIESDKISEEYSKLIKQVSGRIQVLITKDTNRATNISDILYQWKNSTTDLDEDDDDDTEIELEDFEEKDEQSAFDFERELFNKLKSICRKQSLIKYDKNTKFSKRDRELVQLIPELESQTEYDRIGQTAYFKKYFERIIKGVAANVFREIPMIYKKYRRYQLNIGNINWDLEILEELVKKDKNSRIHPDEQALLLYFTNKVCLSLSNAFPQLFNNLNHSYLAGYKSNCKPVIAIDEASDFSIIDLLAISSFQHPELSSLTLSGDLLQRMTNVGLTAWEDFSEVVLNTEVKNLEVSFRQSFTLLKLAQAIYYKLTGKKASYKSYIEKDESEPKPLIIFSEDEDDKLNWIAERIIEIYKAYGDTIPSIAIFLPNENQLEAFANKLGNVDTLSDVGILVKACRNGDVLGDKNTVRVFSVDKIKGLEFEAVFFHNLDDLQQQNLPNELLLKYLYVGLSRATFYLGLTVTYELNQDLLFILEHFDRSGRTWRN